MKLVSYLASLIAGGLVGAALAIHAPKLINHASQPYAGQDTRQISSLSTSDIDALKKGDGWGLAKPAELNGYPGPAHVLEFADQLSLSRTTKGEGQRSFCENESESHPARQCPD